jgi:hypothetical protein
MSDTTCTNFTLELVVPSIQIDDQYGFNSDWGMIVYRQILFI